MILDTDKIIVVNWFAKEDLEGVVKGPLTSEEYIEFKHWVEDGNMCDLGTELIRDKWDEFKEEQKQDAEETRIKELRSQSGLFEEAYDGPF